MCSLGSDTKLVVLSGKQPESHIPVWCGATNLVASIQRLHTAATGKDYADSIGAGFFETSAKVRALSQLCLASRTSLACLLCGANFFAGKLQR